MRSSWALLGDVMRGADVRQVDPELLATELLAAAPPGAVLLVGDASLWGDVPERSGRDVTKVPIEPGLPGSAMPRILWRRLGVPKRSVAIVLVAGALESCPNPDQLLGELRKVCSTGALVGGVCLLRAPLTGTPTRILPPVGLRAALERSGFAVTRVEPGADAAAFDSHLEQGLGGWPVAEGSASLSPGNARIAEWGSSTGRRPALVHHRMLQLCGGYGWSAEVRAKRPTAWFVVESKPGAADPVPTAPAPTRSFALTAPEGASVAEITMRAPMSSYTAREVAAHGFSGYEPESLAVMLAACDVAPPGDVFDVGANIGVFSLVAAACTSRDVVAFEPMPWLADLAQDAARENGFTSVTVDRRALSDRQGSATFYVSAVSDASNSLNARHRQHADAFPVQLETIDAYVAEGGRAPAVIKIDTETTEPDVLAGAADVLATYRPWIVCELIAPGGRAEDLVRVMEPHGYSYFRITDPARVDSERELTPDPSGKHLNWLFAPVVPDPAFWARVDEWRQRLAACGSRAI